MPLISVIMTAYNAEKYIQKAIDSILQQTLSDFEFIIIDDGSTDNTLSIIKSYKDSRIKLLQPGKIGYYSAKMLLIEKAQCDYIAVMDADDIADSKRLELQYDFLKDNHDYALVGSRAVWIDGNDNLLGKEFPFVEDNNSIRCNLLFVNCFVHTSIMIRRSVLTENSLNYKKIAGEDFDLWIRICQKAKAYNLDAVLIKYRIHNNNMCHSDWYKLGEGISILLSDELKFYFGSNITSEDAAIHLSLVEFSLKNSLQDIPALEQWIYKILDLNSCYHHFEERILSQVLYERILKKFLRLQQYNISVFRTLLRFRKRLQPVLSAELRKKEAAILAFSLTRKRWINL